MPNTTPGLPDSLTTAKAQARRLRTALEGRLPLKHGQSLELIARLHGQESWGHLHDILEGKPSPNAIEESDDPIALAGLVLAERTTVGTLMQDIDNRSRQHYGAPMLTMAGACLSAILSQCAKRQDVDWAGDTSSMPNDVSPSYLRCLKDHDLHEGMVRARALGQLSSRKFTDQVLKMTIDLLQRPVQPRRVGEDVFNSLLQHLTAKFRDMPAYPASELPAARVFDGLHSLVIGQDVSALHAAFPGIIDMRGPGIIHPVEIAKALNTPYPEAGFSSGTVALKFMAGLKIGMRLQDMPSARPAGGERLPVLLSLSDITSCKGAEVLLAQARSLRLHILVHVDRLDMDADLLAPVRSNVSSLTEISPEREVRVKSLSHPSKDKDGFGQIFSQFKRQAR